MLLPYLTVYPGPRHAMRILGNLSLSERLRPRGCPYVLEGDAIACYNPEFSLRSAGQADYVLRAKFSMTDCSAYQLL